MTGPDLAVALDLAVRRGRTTRRLRAHYALRGNTVEAVATDGGRVEVSRHDVSDWADRLTCSCRVDSSASRLPPPPDGPGVPWDLLVGTGAALADHRPDLYDELLGRGDQRVGEVVRRLHSSRGRLRVVGIVPGRCIGWISWILQPDGWRALTPYVERGADGGRWMIRVEHRRPEDLPREIVRWAASVR